VALLARVAAAAELWPGWAELEVPQAETTKAVVAAAARARINAPAILAVGRLGPRAPRERTGAVRTAPRVMDPPCTMPGHGLKCSAAGLTTDVAR
jgi:hypothetical protein